MLSGVPPFILSRGTGVAGYFERRNGIGEHRSGSSGRVKAAKTVVKMVRAVVPEPEPGPGGCDYFVGEGAERIRSAQRLSRLGDCCCIVPSGPSRTNQVRDER